MGAEWPSPPQYGMMRHWLLCLQAEVVMEAMLDEGAPQLWLQAAGSSAVGSELASMLLSNFTTPGKLGGFWRSAAADIATVKPVSEFASVCAAKACATCAARVRMHS